MILKRKKNSFFLIATIFVLFLLAVKILISLETKFNKNLIDTKQFIIANLEGYSSTYGLTNNYSNLQILKNISKSLYLKFIGFNDRPNIDTLNININFDNYQKLLKDKKRFQKNNTSGGLKKNKVNANIIYNGKNYRARIRLKGDQPDHWYSNYRMSFRIELKDDKNIFGFTKFNIHRPISRQHPYDQVFQKLSNDVGNLSPNHLYSYVIVNGKKWGIMNVEEHISKEFIEKQNRKESIVFKFGNDDDLLYGKKSKEFEYPYYKIGDDKLNISIYSEKKYLSDLKYRLWLSYIAQKRLDINSMNIYNIEKYSKAFILSTLWGNWHTLSPINSRNYFNPYLLKLEPITADQAEPNLLKNYNYEEKMKNNLFDPYNHIIKSSEYKKTLNKNIDYIFEKSINAKDYLDYYESFFPLDAKNISLTEILNENRKAIFNNKGKYLDPLHEKNLEIKRLPNQKESKFFEEHIYARHFNNGKLEIYNLLPDTVHIKEITYKKKTLPIKSFKLNGFLTGKLKPKIINTNINRIADKEIRIITEYKDKISEKTIPFTLIPPPYLNPLTDISNKFDFIYKKNDKETYFKKGKFKIYKPIFLTGKVFIEPGTNLIFNNNSFLIIKGQLIALGNKEKIIFDTDNSWKGIYIIGDNIQESILKNVVVKNTNALTSGLLELTGGVNFYESKITIEDTEFIGSKAEDALNIINSNFKIKNITIGDTISDGLDVDFSKGKILNSEFYDIGGDAIDLSGSLVNLNNTKFKNIRDKAISVGEASNMFIKNVKINNAGVGIVSKDGSNVKGSNFSIKNYKLYSAMTYQKKRFYGIPKLNITNFDYDETNSKQFLAQENSIMYINQQLIETQMLNVKELYKMEIMKK